MTNEFEKKLERIRALKNCTDLKQTVNEATQIIGHGIILIDTSYNLFAFSEGIVTDDHLWNEITTQGYFSHESVNFFNKENFIIAFAESDVVSIMKSEQLKYDRMNGKLFDEDNVQLGNITVIALKKPFQKGDAELIEALCEILSVKLQESEFYQKIDRVYQKSFVSELIYGNVSKQKIKNQLAGLYEGLKSNLYLAAVDISRYDRTTTHLAYFRDVFKRIQPEFRYRVHLNNIIILISTDNISINISRDLNALEKFFKENELYAGISSQFQDLSELQKYYREAIIALNLGLKCGKVQNFFLYDNCRVEHFLRNANLDEICSPLAYRILEYDKIHGTSYLNILYTYLTYAKDAKCTATALNIEENELIESINMLEKTFEVDWINGDMLYNLFLSIKMMRN